MVDPTENPFEEPLDVDDLFSGSEKVFGWPYDGERVVTLSGVYARADEVRHSVYDENGAEVKWDARQQLPDPLPAGYTAAPELQLVLKMTVDDRNIPEPQYPPTVKLGDTVKAQISADGTQFRFLKKDGTPRMPDGSSGYAAFIRALAAAVPSFLAAASVVKSDPEMWWNTDLFEGLTFVMGPVTTSYTIDDRKFESTKPMPLRAVDADEAVSAPAPAAQAEPVDDAPRPSNAEFNLAEAANNAKTAQEFLTAVLRSGDKELISSAIGDPVAAWKSAKAEAVVA